MSLLVSVVIPACNEASVIDIPIKRAQKAFQTYNYSGEILIMDSSTDRTPEIARSLGCRVIPTPKKGLGKAYIDAESHTKGKYVVMGDADGTYDFMEMNRFIEKLEQGYDFVMGTRLKGSIHRHAMPWSHRYIGTPLLTFFINLLFRANISDCNSGLRALTKEAYQRIQLMSWGWEYASEMVIKAKIAGLKMTEVPVSLLPDSRGREPLLSPWKAGYTNLRVIFLLAADRLFIKTGLGVLIAGTAIMLSQLFGPISIQGVYFGMYYLFLGLILSFSGISLLQMGILTRMFSFIKGFHNTKWIRHLKACFSFEKGLLVSILFGSIGIGFLILALLRWLKTGEISNDEMKLGLYSVYGIGLAIQGLIFSFSYYLFDLSDQYKNE